METVVIVVQQTIVMFLYMLAGFLPFKSGKLTASGSKDMGTLLLWVMLPVVIINSFCVEFSIDRLKQLALSSLLGILAILAAMAIARILFGKYPIDDFAAAFSNAGFIGIPLVRAAFGDEAVFYIAGIIAMLNILQWTYGVRILTGKKTATNLRNTLLNPILISAVIGLCILVAGLGVRLPSVISTTLQGISALNAPLAMLILGSYLAQVNLKKMFFTIRLYWLCVVRLLIIPLVTILLFWFLPMPSELKLSVFIAASAPVGANVAVYAQINDLDYPYACQTVALSTLFSIVSLPPVLLIARWIL